jgi:hypothetical protein
MKDIETTASRAPVVREERQLSGIADFLQIFQEMEETGEKKRDITGEAQGPFFSRAVYKCVIRLGMDCYESNASSHRRSI